MTTTTTAAVDSFLDAVQGGSISSCSVWASDVVLDATVPEWRFRVTGPAAVREEYGRWFADPGRFEELVRIPVAGGEVVRYLLTWVENGVPHAAHHMHHLQVSDGVITADTVLCGGRWPASLLAEMQAAQQATDAHAHHRAHDDGHDHAGHDHDDHDDHDASHDQSRIHADVDV